MLHGHCAVLGTRPQRRADRGLYCAVQRPTYSTSSGSPAVMNAAVQLQRQTACTKPRYGLTTYVRPASRMEMPCAVRREEALQETLPLSSFGWASYIIALVDATTHPYPESDCAYFPWH